MSGDTWGLNFTSATDARAFRECISSIPASGGKDGPRRAESSYSLRDQQSGHQPSKAGSGAHLTTKYYANRTAISTPNSPSKRRLQQVLQGGEGNQMVQNYAQGVAQPQAQCTCDCLTADLLHKQVNCCC